MDMDRTLHRRRFSAILIVSFLYFGSCTSTRNVPESIRQWEPEIAAFDKLNQTEKYPDNSILFLGSSSIRLWNTLGQELAPYPIIQRGFGGSNSPAVLHYTKRIVYPHKFAALVIFIANDITGSQNDLSPTESAENFRKIVRTVRAKFRQQPIFIVEITPSQSRWAKWPLIKQDNVRLKELCTKEKNLYFIETARSFLDEKSEPKNELFRDDFLHLNHNGYKIWGKLIKAELDRRIKDKG